MGVTMGSMLRMEQQGLLGAGRSLLDFGSSNLYTATKQEIVDFVRRHNGSPRRDLESWAQKLAEGSRATGPEGPAPNLSFIGQVLEEAGMTYDAIDIADGYKTTIVDLNTNRLPKHMIGAYDSVINCGTSEHILNQMSTFAAVHEATKPGGLMLHTVPCVGFQNHGYFTYTSRFFFDLAGYNNYEVIDMWFERAGTENLFAAARQYTTYFPALNDRLARIGKEPSETAIDALEIPTVAIGLLMRRRTGDPFMGTVETSTSVGNVPKSVLSSYMKKLIGR